MMAGRITVFRRVRKNVQVVHVSCRLFVINCLSDTISDFSASFPCLLLFVVGTGATIWLSVKTCPDIPVKEDFDLAEACIQ